MTTYSDIRGYRVKYLASDPTLNTSTEGQVWYNSTSGTLKSLVQIKAWSSGGNLSTARYHSGPATSAPSTAGMVAAGFSNSSPETATNVTEEYNGFSWSSGGNVNTARANLGGAGIQTAALIFGGYSGAPNVGYNLTEEYDGSAWTSGGTLPVNTSLPIGAGTQTAGLSIGGLEIGVAALTTTNLYNGTSWTSTGHNINDDGYGGAGVGTSTAALIMGGDGRVSSVESYDGSSWTAVTNLVSANGRNAGAGTNTFANCFGGSTNPTANQTWDGNTWVSVTGLSTGRARLMGFGTATQSVAAGGYTTTQLANTEEYVSSIDAYSPSTVAAWASGGNLGTARSYIMPAMQSTQTAGLVAGGENPLKTNVEEYNGSAWSEQNDIPTGIASGAGAGTQTSGIVFGGNIGATVVNNSFEYDGTNWTAGGSLNTARQTMGGFGSQTACISAGGDDITGTPRYVAVCESYNGTAWTNTTSLPNTRQLGLGNAGTSTAGLVFGGFDGTARITTTSEWNGSTWTNVPATISAAKNAHAGSGTQTAALLYGGFLPPATNVCQGYDGTNWSTRPNMSTARYALGGSGPSGLALAIGGSTGTDSSATEEFTGDSPISPTGAVASTLTTS
jgi:hypothetical protein